MGRLLVIRARLVYLRLAWRRLVPQAVSWVLDQLRGKASPQTYVVGGTVRDLLLGRRVRDWDIATRALPHTVQQVFPHTVPTGIEHGTVTVIHDGWHIEVTTLRREGPYSDGRRPDYVSFDAVVGDDLARRDFTINAMAFGPPVSGAAPAPGNRRGVVLYDPHGGLRDLAAGIVRAVGDPAARFAEDRLRILRAYRIAAELGMDIDPETGCAAAAAAHLLPSVSAERIRAELDRILLSPRVAWCLEQLRLAGAAQAILPELARGAGFEQNEFHPYDVWEHSVITCAATPPILHLRLAGLLHDVGKPLTLSVDPSGRRHFFGHEKVGADVARDILERLRYDRETITRVVHLVARHMDFHDLPEGAGDAAVRRAASRVGREHIADLLHLREADRVAAGKGGGVSRGTLDLLARLRALDRADAALSLRDLKIDGYRVMELTGLQPGPTVGRILEALLDAVIEDPALNNPEDLARLCSDLALRLRR